VIQDLRKSDSVIRALTQRARAYLTERIAERRKQISSAGRVEIVETTADDSHSQNDALIKEDEDARRR
jgi:hypothetical protein